MTLLRYLFQSCVSASEGGKAGRLEPIGDGPALGRIGGEWIGIEEMRWLDADEGVRRSNMRSVESEETEDIREGEWGEKAVL